MCLSLLVLSVSLLALSQLSAVLSLLHCFAEPFRCLLLLSLLLLLLVSSVSLLAQLCCRAALLLLNRVAACSGLLVAARLICVAACSQLSAVLSLLNCFAEPFRCLLLLSLVAVLVSSVSLLAHSCAVSRCFIVAKPRRCLLSHVLVAAFACAQPCCSSLRPRVAASCSVSLLAQACLSLLVSSVSLLR
jgi:hypothetical protein